MIPLHDQILGTGLLGTCGAVILPSLAFGLTLGVFPMQAFLEDMPEELVEDGRVGGCSPAPDRRRSRDRPGECRQLVLDSSA